MLKRLTLRSRSLPRLLAMVMGLSLAFALFSGTAGASLGDYGHSFNSARSSNYSQQSNDQEQNTNTVAAPVTLLSGNTIAVGSSGNNTSSASSEVSVAPTQTNNQSSEQSSEQSSSASAGK
jgi:hypothetical protein